MSDEITGCKNYLQSLRRVKDNLFNGIFKKHDEDRYFFPAAT